MSFSDFLLINGGSLMSYGIGFVILGFVYFLFKDIFEYDETQEWFRIIMGGLALLMLLTMSFSLIKSLYVHTERTTIDRSVSDEAQQDIENKVQKGESR